MMETTHKKVFSGSGSGNVEEQRQKLLNSMKQHLHYIFSGKQMQKVNQLGFKLLLLRFKNQLKLLVRESRGQKYLKPIKGDDSNRPISQYCDTLVFSTDQTYQTKVDLSLIIDPYFLKNKFSSLKTLSLQGIKTTNMEFIMYLPTESLKSFQCMLSSVNKINSLVKIRFENLKVLRIRDSSSVCDKISRVSFSNQVKSDPIHLSRYIGKQTGSPNFLQKLSTPYTVDFVAGTLEDLHHPFKKNKLIAERMKIQPKEPEESQKIKNQKNINEQMNK